MNFLKDRDVLLVTIHQKEKVIKPLLEGQFGCHMHVSPLDTDQFGTFTREVSRQQSQFDTARRKVTMGLKLTNHRVGVASEGMFGFHPLAPIPWNTELVLLKDDELELELYGYYEGLNTNFSHTIVQDYPAALQFANQVGFPDHHVILRADDEHSSVILKDIMNESLLQEAFKYCFYKSTNRQVFIETDMRAYANPTRMKNIEIATRQLIEQANSLCPSCGTPGFRIVQKVPGRLCEQCHTPTKQIVQHVYACSTCQCQQTKDLEDIYASPRYCDLCNP
ncbi:DUF6671 family protein [Exiguobacterium sp. AM39-5BH]|uniref:DUF6671 family protein n=1 Tax=Exiguobacterium sp. AM39-5BH TaxID=2292355 RepID=UPI000FE1C581|nr:DUF6671 family protein [Exiguobacterium sp. AM39-5BH]RHB48321.1 hypothetical protein DW881_12100 [Exiguobacterium sp. AM39-5BH]